jgi:hypothetical protein
MAYFNHAFKKTFLGTGTVGTNANGFSTLPNGTVLGTSTSNVLAPGALTYINPNNWQISNTPPTACCEFILASGAMMDNDKIGPFHGGYKESNKSKTVKGKYISKVWASPAQLPTNYVLHVGTTPYTAVTPPVSGDPGETAGTCCKKFLCGETYYLRVDVKGSPALRFLNHNAYLTLEAYTGCCADDDIAPTPVDPGMVYIQWAKQLVESPIMKNLVYPVVLTSLNGTTNFTAYYPDNTVTLPAPSGNITTVARYRDYVNNGYTANECAGMVLVGAYADTRFENCTFQLTDFYELEPLRVYASEVDLTGSPCEFDTLCVGVECYGRQANGVGETVVRDVILSEAYRQNFFHSDLRIREITQGNDLLNGAGLNRTSFYDRIFIQHNIPRLYNPTGTFDNDQYLLEVVFNNATPNGNLSTAASNFLTGLTSFITSCGNNDCTYDNIDTTGANCTSLVPIPAIV